MRLTREDKESIAGFLEEYLSIFKEEKQHKKFHYQEPCPKCILANEILAKLNK